MTARSRRALPLRAIRGAVASIISTAMSTFPAIEPVVIRCGRSGAKRSRLLGGLYRVVQERVIVRLKRQGERFRTVHVLGRRLQLDITDSTGRMPHFYDTPYEPAVTDAIVTALRPGDVFVDIGANVGYFTVLAAHVVGAGGSVVAFEPHTGARERLETIVQRNEVAARVEIVPAALAEAEGRATLFTEEEFSAYSTLEPSASPMRHVATLKPAIEVALTTLDHFMDGRPDLRARVRCIKIDVEGAEGRALAGMSRSLQTPGLTIVCETSIGSDGDARLAAAGFQRKRIEHGTGPYGNFLYVRP